MKKDTKCHEWKTIIHIIYFYFTILSIDWQTNKQKMFREDADRWEKSVLKNKTSILISSLDNHISL